MRLVQTSMSQTGALILKGNNEYKVFPLFTKSYITESNDIRRLLPKELSSWTPLVFSTESKQFVLGRIKEFKATYGVIPENLVAELRTGFSGDCVQLQQYSAKFCYV